ncbi:MAG: zinc ABC transporter substrate-binding protein [Planctomycetes bacterium]|jgi:zinc transport system substrate-binding protein|nr:zinc ABC transporter substrate-binding protein [Planctomycetota bacterium]
MRGSIAAIFLAGITALMCPGCRDTQPAMSKNPGAVAVTNSLLLSAVKDLMGDDEPVLLLSDAGSCPGHFDLRPSQAWELSHKRLLLRMDFQAAMDSKLSAAAKEGLRISAISVREGLAVPSTYVQVCQQAADALVEAGLMDRLAVEKACKRIAERMNLLAERQLERSAELRDAPVLCSVHQQSFCQWLGMRVVGVFASSDSAGVEGLNRAVIDGREARVKLIVANLPEGTKVAQALGGRLDAKVVVLGNFPTVSNGRALFDELVSRNVTNLLEARQ